MTFERSLRFPQLRSSHSRAEWYVKQIMRTIRNKFEISLVDQYSRTILMVVVALTLTAGAAASRILFAVVFPGQSHWLMFEPVIHEVHMNNRER